MALSKSKRFKIFARDSFTCQYCGRRPPDVILEVDHIFPRSRDGSDDDLNLTTSCFDCNRGKAAKIITEVAPKPDADLKYLALLQEEAEVRRYLEASRRLEYLRKSSAERLQEVWDDLIGGYALSEKQWTTWLIRYSPEEIENAIRIVAPKHSAGYFGSSNYQTVKYVSGVLKRVREQAVGQNVQ